MERKSNGVAVRGGLRKVRTPKPCQTLVGSHGVLYSVVTLYLTLWLLHKAGAGI